MNDLKNFLFEELSKTGKYQKWPGSATDLVLFLYSQYKRKAGSTKIYYGPQLIRSYRKNQFEYCACNTVNNAFNWLEKYSENVINVEPENIVDLYCTHIGVDPQDISSTITLGTPHDSYSILMECGLSSKDATILNKKSSKVTPDKQLLDSVFRDYIPQKSEENIHFNLDIPDILSKILR